MALKGLLAGLYFLFLPLIAAASGPKARLIIYTAPDVARGKEINEISDDFRDYCRTHADDFSVRLRKREDGRVRYLYVIEIQEDRKTGIIAQIKESLGRRVAIELATETFHPIYHRSMTVAAALRRLRGSTFGGRMQGAAYFYDFLKQGLSLPEGVRDEITRELNSLALDIAPLLRESEEAVDGIVQIAKSLNLIGTDFALHSAMDVARFPQGLAKVYPELFNSPEQYEKYFNMMLRELARNDERRGRGEIGNEELYLPMTALSMTEPASQRKFRNRLVEYILEIERRMRLGEKSVQVIKVESTPAGIQASNLPGHLTLETVLDLLLNPHQYAKIPGLDLGQHVAASINVLTDLMARTEKGNRLFKETLEEKLRIVRELLEHIDLESVKRSSEVQLGLQCAEVLSKHLPGGQLN